MAIGAGYTRVMTTLSNEIIERLKEDAKASERRHISKEIAYIVKKYYEEKDKKVKK